MDASETTGDWDFARRPFWLFSHLFAATVILSFIGLGFWQLDRLDERQRANQLIESRSEQAMTLGRSPTTSDGTDLDFTSVEATVRFVDGDIGRVVNRSRNGIAGEHVVAVAELSDGSAIAVNRGFVPVGFDRPLDPLPTGPVEVTGWLRATVDRGRFGAEDLGSGTILPRFDTEAVAARLGRDLPPVWLQLATVGGRAAGPSGSPEVLDLPPLDDGPHLSYAVQWFIFAALGLAFYGALLRRRAGGHRSTVTVVEPEPDPEVDAVAAP